MPPPKLQQGFAPVLLNLDSPETSGAVLYSAGAITAASSCDRTGVVELTFPWSRLERLHGLPHYQPGEEASPAPSRLFLTALGDEILRVTSGGTDTETDSPMLELSGDLTVNHLSVETLAHGWRITDAQGRTRAIIDHTPPVLTDWNHTASQTEPANRFQLTLLPDGHTEVTFNSTDYFGGWKFDSLPLFQVRQNGKTAHTGFALKADSDECFSGTGERFAKMDLSGRTLHLQNQDGLGVNNSNTYKNVPFYLSSRAYGLFLHTSNHIKLSLAGVSNRSVVATVNDPALDMFCIGGGTPARILHNYRRVTGFPALPPLWSYGTWMSRMTYFSADEVTGIARRLREENYPCDVLHLDTGWFAKDWICEWRFNAEKFPDPAGFMSSLKRDGFRVTLWQTPYIGKGNCLLDEARLKGYLGQAKAEIAAEASGSDFSGQQIGGHIDFSNPEAVAWYKDMLRELLQMGASAIKTDFGEDISDADYHLPLAKLRNRYALLYQQAAFEVTKEVTGDSIIWARAGWAGCQRYPLHWGGDAECSWDGLGSSLKGGLHLGLSGFAFWSHDVPGFHGTPNFMHSAPPEDLYLRWTQFGVLSSHLRYHGTSPREPWEFPGVAEVTRQWWRLRYAIIPYLTAQAELICRNGLPMLQALWLRHPEDIAARHIDDQYYLGEYMLVAPVISRSGVRDIYLPPSASSGDGAVAWIDLWTGRSFAGGQWLRKVASPLSTIPVFIRAGARLPIYPEMVASTADMDPGKVQDLVFDETYRGLDSSVIAYADPRMINEAKN
ncbi:MAG: alpha-xylosidase [Verrucomicrobiota bacterium]